MGLSSDVRRDFSYESSNAFLESKEKQIPTEQKKLKFLVRIKLKIFFCFNENIFTWKSSPK